ncbi:MAG: MBL fold metallo-hydrolase [Deltaproteobacteria bacterium]|nr:MBL fold metallo-hydrolase [Deltaproteobacteria bacterium]
MVSVLAAVVLPVAGCCHRSVRPASVERPGGAEMVLVHGDSRVGTYVSRPEAFSTSSYWIEGPTGLILIDTQFLFSAATELVDWAEKVTGKKAVLAIVLHPNPDKFNGTEILKKRGIRVVSSEQVVKLIPEIHEDRHHWFYDRYKPDYPDVAPVVESFGAGTVELAAAGLKVKAHVLGAGCSEAHVVVEFDDHVFAGDLVANNHHSWLEIGKTDEWLRRLAEIRALHPQYVHPGRGANGGAELLDREESYLRHVVKLVAREHPRMPAPDAAIERIKAQLEKDYPGYGNAYFLEIGLPAEWERQAGLRRHSGH